MLLTFKGHTSFLYSASFNADSTQIVTASYDNTAKVWDAKTGAVMSTLKAHTLPVTSAAFSPDGKRILTLSIDKTARVWDAKTGAELLSLKGVGNGGFWAFSVDGLQIVASGNSAQIWDSQPFRDSRPLAPEVKQPR